MAMNSNGLAKLMEECGELTQIAAKKLAYMHTDEHPDGAGPMSIRMEEEMGDVIAAISFVAWKLNLDEGRILDRADMKVQRFEEWDKNSDI